MHTQIHARHLHAKRRGPTGLGDRPGEWCGRQSSYITQVTDNLGLRTRAADLLDLHAHFINLPRHSFEHAQMRKENWVDARPHGVKTDNVAHFRLTKRFKGQSRSE